jgi:chromosome segregation ATPase
MTQESSLSAAVEDRPGASDPGGRAAHIAHLEGQIEVLRGQLASLEAADEHHRGEFAAARAEAAEAQATLRETQARLAERQQTIDDLRHRLEAAQASQSRAEQERTAVIEALGRRAKRRLSGTD